MQHEKEDDPPRVSFGTNRDIDASVTRPGWLRDRYVLQMIKSETALGFE